MNRKLQSLLLLITCVIMGTAYASDFGRPVQHAVSSAPQQFGADAPTAQYRVPLMAPQPVQQAQYGYYGNQMQMYAPHTPAQTLQQFDGAPQAQPSYFMQPPMQQLSAQMLTMQSHHQMPHRVPQVPIYSAIAHNGSASSHQRVTTAPQPPVVPVAMQMQSAAVAGGAGASSLVRQEQVLSHQKNDDFDNKDIAEQSVESHKLPSAKPTHDNDNSLKGSGVQEFFKLPPKITFEEAVQCLPEQYKKRGKGNLFVNCPEKDCVRHEGKSKKMNLRQIKKHYDDEHPTLTIPDIIPCPYNCGVSFFDQKSFPVHFRKKHPNPKKVKSPPQPSGKKSNRKPKKSKSTQKMLEKTAPALSAGAGSGSAPQQPDNEDDQQMAAVAAIISLKRSRIASTPTAEAPTERPAKTRKLDKKTDAASAATEAQKDKDDQDHDAAPQL